MKFPLIRKSVTNEKGKLIHFYFNYSAKPNLVTYSRRAGKELFSGKDVTTNTSLEI